MSDFYLFEAQPCDRFAFEDAVEDFDPNVLPIVGPAGPQGPQGPQGPSGEYSSTNPPPYPVTSVCDKTGAVELDKGDVGLDNVDNVQQYSADNPPPYPVTSVNGQTGDVSVPTGGSMVFGADTLLTLTAPTGINKITDKIYAQKTADGKFLRLYGYIRTYAAATYGWYDFPASGLTVEPPASELTLNGVGIWLDENMAIGYDTTPLVRIKVDTSGNISIGLFYKYNLGQNTNIYNYLLFPFIFPLA